MKKESQEAMKWLKPEEHWEPEYREKASRRFFQVWNSQKGTRSDSFIKANAPLRCTVWRSSVRKFDEILNDLILRDKEGLIDTFTRGLEEVYPQLESQAKTNPQLQEQLYAVDALLGKGRYEHEGIKTKLLHLQEIETQKEAPSKKRSPAESVVRAFYDELNAFPALQKKYLEAVTDLKYIDVEGKLGRGVSGYHTGTSSIGGAMRPNKLLTFFLMKDPFPYIASKPKGTVEEITKQFPNGNQIESPMEGTPGTKKVFSPISTFPLPGGAKLYVQNQKNPDYDFVTINPHEALKQADAKRKIQQKVIELQKQSMFENTFLANNVLQNSQGFEDKGLVPGISILHLGRESDNFDISDDERDLTKLDKGRLFWIPESGLPQTAEKPVATPTTPEGKNTFTWKGKEAQIPPSKNLFSHSIASVLAQSVELEDMWFDDKGEEYDSMEQIEEKYQQDAIEEGKSHMKEMIGSILESILSQGAKAAPAPVPEVEPVEVPEEEEAEIVQMPQEEEVLEEELSLAAKQVSRLVRIANLLDNKGFSQEADLIDNIVRDIISTQK